MVLIGRVAGLAMRPVGTPAPISVSEMGLVAGLGADGDRHADPRSPRQLLLAGADAYADYALAPHALRENLLFDFDVAQLVSGTVLRIGTQALLQVMFGCEACGQLDQHGKRLAARIGSRRGMLARVLRGGAVHSGDDVNSLGPMVAAWPDDWRQRIARVLDAVPRESVVDYAQLARLAGIQTSYCRAFPRLLDKLGPAYAERAVTARSSVTQPRWDGAGLFAPTPAEASRLDAITSARI